MDCPYPREERTSAATLPSCEQNPQPWLFIYGVCIGSTVPRKIKHTQGRDCLFIRNPSYSFRRENKPWISGSFLFLSLDKLYVSPSAHWVLIPTKVLLHLTHALPACWYYLLWYHKSLWRLCSDIAHSCFKNWVDLLFSCGLQQDGLASIPVLIIWIVAVWLWPYLSCQAGSCLEATSYDLYSLIITTEFVPRIFFLLLLLGTTLPPSLLLRDNYFSFDYSLHTRPSGRPTHFSFHNILLYILL